MYAATSGVHLIPCANVIRFGFEASQASRHAGGEEPDWTSSWSHLAAWADSESSHLCTFSKLLEKLLLPYPVRVTSVLEAPGDRALQCARIGGIVLTIKSLSCVLKIGGAGKQSSHWQMKRKNVYGKFRVGTRKANLLFLLKQSWIVAYIFIFRKRYVPRTPCLSSAE